MPYAGDNVWPLEFYDEGPDYDEEDFYFEGRDGVDPDLMKGLLSLYCPLCGELAPCPPFDVAVGNPNGCCAFCLDAFEREDAPWELAVTLGDIDLREANERVWHCTLCGESLRPFEVTYSEHHDSREGGCGGRCI